MHTCVYMQLETNCNMQVYTIQRMDTKNFLRCADLYRNSL